MMSYRENLQKCHEYVRGLEEERRKIQMFQKELPLCLDIITQKSCKQQLPGTITATTTTITTECSEQTTSDDLVFEEFMPIKMQNSPAPGSTYRDREEGEEEEEDNSELESRKTTSSIDVSQKSDWLRSAQLWNQSPDPPTREEEEGEKNSRMLQVRKVSVVEVTQSTTPTTEIATQSTSCSRSGGSKEGRKSRRCWSPELHRRFLNALEQLGGPHVATPKQIRELLKVDGLTNDEVKSHLQKYRLHSSRRATTNNSNSTQAAPQFVVVGGMWVPPTNSRDAVAPRGAPVGQHQPRHHAATNITDITNNNSNNNGGRCCNSSPQTSSSSAPPTTTPSPACN